MKTSFKYSRALAILNLIFISSISSAFGNTSMIDSKKIENLIQQTLPNTAVGIYLQDINTGKVLYDRRANELFQPGSNAKLFSAATALYILGSQFKYSTEFLAAANAVKSGTLQGNLYLKFSGDPSLTSDDLINLVKDLKKTGIQKIAGDLVIDNTLFKDPSYAPGWGWNNLCWHYGAPITSIIINGNKIKLELTPNKTLGEKGKVTLAPDEIVQAKIAADIISVTEMDANENCRLDVAVNQNNDISMQGCWPAKDKSDVLKLALANPARLAEQLIKQALKTEKITLTGKIILGSTPPQLKPIVVHESVPLADLLKPILSDSNNLYAESITKMMGVIKFQQGTFQAGTHAIKEVLAKDFGIPGNQLSLEDGSGLSRFDLVSPLQITRLLYVMSQNKAFSDLYISAFPSAGITGTLKNRMETFDLKGQIKAKTGTLSNVSALSGYILENEKPRYIFSIMINNALESRDTKQFENELCLLFLQELKLINSE